jgi:hypothetical protein
MPKYRIEGQVYDAANEDEAYAKHDAAKGRQPSVTVTKIGDQEIDAMPSQREREETNALLQALGKTARAAGPYLAAGAAGAAAGAPIGGVGAIPGAIAGMTAYGLGSTAADIATGGRASQAVEGLMTQAGLPELETGPERVAAQGLRGALGGFSAARSAMALRDAQGMIPQTTTQRVIGTMAEQPAAQTAAAGLAGGASQATAELGAPPLVSLGAGMVAGGLPFMGRGTRPMTDSRLRETPSTPGLRDRQPDAAQPQGARTAGVQGIDETVKEMPPNVIRAQHAERLQRFGIPITPAQMSGNPAAQTAESVMRYLPTSAPRAARFYDDQMAGFTRAALRYAGIDSDRATPQVLDAAQKRFGQIYDQLEANTVLTGPREDLLDRLATVEANYGKGFSGESREVFNTYKDDILNYLAGTPKAGQTFQRLSEQLSEAIGKASRDTAPSSQRYGMALQGLKDMLFDVMETNTAPQVAQAWRDTNRQYAIFSTIKNAMRETRQETLNTNYINPRKLANLQEKARRREWIMGDPDADTFTNLVKAGAALIPDPIPNSGTAQRMFAQDILQGGQRMFGSRDVSPLTGAAAMAGGGAVGGAVEPISLLGVPYVASRMYYGAGAPGAQASMTAAGAPPTQFAPVGSAAAFQAQKPRTRREQLADELRKR